MAWLEPRCPPPRAPCVPATELLPPSSRVSQPVIAKRAASDWRRTRGTLKPCQASPRTFEGWTTTCAAHFPSKTGLGRSIGSAGLRRRPSCTQAGKAAAANSGGTSKQGADVSGRPDARHDVAIAFMGGVGTETLCDLHEDGGRSG